ncbi:hypothetical protein RGQ29_028042 [Quercus rubra]|uniref:BHLH domain-containing protein n=1 Tax=Quercus rubra TaxID=3512 RepID=A0AAN7ER41_QUERU|nr:hypothetical protein RGQ29_028042 [Quercus rubra]
MEPFAWSSNTIAFGSDGLVNDELLVNSSMVRNGSDSSSSLVLDSERSELVEARMKLERKGGTAERTIAALKSHCEAERRRRARINSHLDTLRGLVPGAKKMDKASLLAEVISHMKELKRSAEEASDGFVIPMDFDEVIVEREDGFDGDPYSIRASLCCDFKPGLLSDLKQALSGLHLIIIRAEIATLGGRMKNVLVMTNRKEGEVNHSEVRQALRSVLDKFSGSQEFLLGTTFSNKRQRISIFNCSSSSSLGDVW